MIEGYPLYEDRTEGMGAVAAYTYGEHTVVFVGTRSGQLKKVGAREKPPLLVVGLICGVEVEGLRVAASSAVRRENGCMNVLKIAFGGP